MLWNFSDFCGICSAECRHWQSASTCKAQTSRIHLHTFTASSLLSGSDVIIIHVIHHRPRSILKSSRLGPRQRPRSVQIFPTHKETWIRKVWTILGLHRISYPALALAGIRPFFQIRPRPYMTAGFIKFWRFEHHYFPVYFSDSISVSAKCKVKSPLFNNKYTPLLNI